MEQKFKTSFIPKKPIATQPKAVVSKRSGFNFVTLIAVVIFVAAALFSIGVYLYRISLERTIDSQLDTLERAKEAFDPGFISEATRLSNRLSGANRILNNHLSPSAIFELLEESTLQTVSFSSFEFEYGLEGGVRVTASGEGDSFRSIVLQSDEFGRSGYLKDVLFSDLEPNTFGNIGFTFEAMLDPQLVLYRKSLRPVENDEVEIQEDTGPAEDLGIFGGDGDNNVEGN